MNSQNWFDVDKEGLSKLLARRGKQFVLFELLSNCWDTDAGKVSVSLQPTDKRGVVALSVIDDDPNGFANLDHAYTLFAESSRKGDASKRGRFNLGEKLILAVCDEAEIRSTKGTIIFNSGRHQSRKRREAGTEFYGLVRMTQPEMKVVLEACRTLLPPVETVINGQPLVSRLPLHEFTVTLPTEVADDEGYLRRTARQTNVRVYERNGTSRLYEMGIPVVETDDPWDVEIMQKVPLNADRDNVTPAYLREVRTKVLNEMHEYLPADQAALPAVLDALANANPEAVESVLTKTYGEKRAIYDPSDHEANRTLQSQGYSLIMGNAFSKETWQNIREANAAKPAGQIAPTYQPYSENGKPATYISEDKWTDGMRNIADYVNTLGHRLLGRSIRVLFESGRFTAPFGANYGGRVLTFNHDRLGKKWFEQSRKDEAVNNLLIHELSHEYGRHLTEEFDDALSRLGAKLVELALTEPSLFRDKE